MNTLTSFLQIEQRRKQTAVLRECREKAEELIKSTASELNKANEGILLDGSDMAPHPLTAAAAAEGGKDGGKDEGKDGGKEEGAEEDAKTAAASDGSEAKRKRIESMVAKLSKLQKK